MLVVTIMQIITVSLLVILGVGIWLEKRSDATRLRFLLFSGSVAAWLVAGFFSDMESVWALFFNRLIFIFPLFIIYSAFLLINRLAKHNSQLELPLLVIVMAACSLLSFTDLVVVDITRRIIEDQFSGFNIVRGSAYPLYLGAVAAGGLLVVGRLFVLYSRAKGVRRQQLLIVEIGLVGTLVIGILLSGIIPFVTGSSSSSNYAFLAGLVAVASFAFAIIRHGLFDIRTVVVRSSAYALSLLALAAIYYSLVYVASTTIFQNQTTAGVSVSPVNVLLALLLAFIFQPIKSFFDKATNKIFYRDRYDSSEFYLRLNEVLTGTTSLEQLLKDAAKELQSTLKSEQVFFAVARSRSDYIQSGTSKHHHMPVKDIHDINRLVESEGDKQVITSLLSDDHRHIRRILLSHKIELLMPLVRHGAIIGYLLLGEQRTGGYTKRDLRVLETISDELVIAIQHTLSVQEVKSINEHLEQRIHVATAELRTSNARLKRLDTAKDEFLSMASHQLRTPLTSVKGYLSMMLEGDVGKTTPMQKKVLEEAFSSSERMVHLIHDFLNVSRLQTGKFMLELQPTDLVKLIKEEVQSLQSAAKSRNMTIEFTNKAGDVQMQLDDTKIRQVVMNYIDNAIYYSHPETTITVELAKKDKQITLKVKDTGIGVPANEQAQLFGKFYRATNARKQRPDGTGVGLYLAKKVITALGGDVLFTSKLGKGSTFGFYLPVQAELEKKNANKLEQKPNNN